MSLSQSDTLVYFDTKTKKFIPCNRYEDAIQLVTTAPEGWYIALKNPAPGNKHPQPGTSNSIPENMEIGFLRTSQRKMTNLNKGERVNRSPLFFYFYMI